MKGSATVATMNRSPIAILGVPFDCVNLAETLALADEMIASGQPHYAPAVGVDFLVQSQEDVELRRVLADAHLVIAEEKAIIRASKLLGNLLPEDVTAAHLIPQLLAHAEEKNWRVFFLGGGETVVEKLRARHPKLQLAGNYSPPDKPLLEMDHADILRRVRAAKPDLLLVAFGSAKQEKWIFMNYREAGVPLVLGAGTLFDFATGQSRPQKYTGKIFRQFLRSILRQWWRLRVKKSTAPVFGADVIPDSFGNLVIHAPSRLGAAEVQASRAEWLRAVENNHVMFDLAGTVFADSTGIGVLIRLRKRAQEMGRQFFLVAPRPPVEAALKLMKLDDFFSIQSTVSGVRILMESAAGASPVTSGVLDAELQIRWTGEVTALNAVELGAHTESELSQAVAGMNVVIDLSRVTFVDSTGIGLMVRFKKNLKRRDLNLKFAAATAPVRNVVRQAQLEEFLFH
jgi:exopolysaccharide biosynthesis WecB/TagA/CpsF family protein/anti-anti-sigma factor